LLKPNIRRGGRSDALAFAIMCRCRRRSYADVIRQRDLPESENRQKRHMGHNSKLTHLKSASAPQSLTIDAFASKEQFMFL
jgi:hypothetical protein